MGLVHVSGVKIQELLRSKIPQKDAFPSVDDEEAEDRNYLKDESIDMNPCVCGQPLFNLT